LKSRKTPLPFNASLGYPLTNRTGKNTEDVGVATQRVVLQRGGEVVGKKKGEGKARMCIRGSRKEDKTHRSQGKPHKVEANSNKGTASGGCRDFIKQRGILKKEEGGRRITMWTIRKFGRVRF